MYGFHGFSKSLSAINYSCSDLTVHCARIEWSPAARSLGSRGWAQECPGLSREGAEAIRIGITAVLVLRASSCKGNTAFSHQIKLFALVGQESLTLLQCVKHLAQTLPPATVQRAGVPREVRHSPTSRLYSPYFPFTDASCKVPQSHSLLCFLELVFLFFFFFSFCRLTGGGCLSVARACMGGGSAQSPWL